MVKNGGWNSIMKRKYLLAILPALLVLSSCQAAPKANVVKEETFIEDTEAHDEIFGNDYVGRKIAPKKLGDDPVVHPDSDASIGIQSIFDNKGNENPADDTYSLRFVAPVAFGEGQITPTNAVWTRTVSKPDGTAYTNMDTGTVASVHAYTQLQNGGDFYTIAQFNTDNSTSYTHFVVYTLRNIPASFANYYVSAYLVLSGEGGVNQTTKAVVTTVDTSIYKAAYVADQGNYFLEGTIGGVANSRVAATRIRNGSNKAEFEYIDFAAGDVFTINEFYNTKLYVHGATECLGYAGSEKINSCFEDDESSAHKLRVKASMGGSYGLYLNVTDNKLYTEADAPYGVHNGFYINGSMTSWTKNAAYEMYNDRNNKAVSATIHLNVNDEFKVWKEEGDVWYGWPTDKAVSANTSLFESTSGNGTNVKCLVAGDYKIFLNNNSEIWINPVE